MQELTEYVIQMRKEHDPLITDIISSLNWHTRIYQQGKKPWIDCRDEKGNLYTLYPEMENNNYLEDVFVVYRQPKANPYDLT